MSKNQQTENNVQDEPRVESQVQTVGVGQYARALIKHAVTNNLVLSNEQLAAKVVEKFKTHGVEVKTSAAAIAWYKNDMRKKGQLAQGAGARAKSIAIDMTEIAL